MVVNLLTHVCVTGSQCLNVLLPYTPHQDKNMLQKFVLRVIYFSFTHIMHWICALLSQKQMLIEWYIPLCIEIFKLMFIKIRSHRKWSAFPYAEPVYPGWSSVRWNATGMPLGDHWDTNESHGEYLQDTPEHQKLSWNCPTLECHWRNSDYCTLEHHWRD